MRKSKFILGLASSVFALSFAMTGTASLNVYAEETVTKTVDAIGGNDGDTATLEEVITAHSEEVRTYLSFGETYTENQQKAIDAIANALNTGATSVRLSRYDIIQDDVAELFAAAKQKNPLGWAAHKSTSGYSWSYTPQTGYATTLIFENDYTKDEIKARYAALKAKVDEIKASVPEGLEQDEIVLYLHDYLAYNTAYDMINYKKNTLGPDVYSAYGPLVNGQAVCQGYSEAFRLLLNEYGIESKIVTSQYLNHAWNQVYLNGKWYHVDVTWDDPTMSNNTMVTSTEDIYGICQHKNFLVDDETIISTGHREWDGGFETCTSKDYINTGITKVNSRAYKVDGAWYYLYNTASGNYLTSNVYKTDDIFGGNLTATKLDAQSEASDYCLGYYDGNFYYTDFFNGEICTVSKDGTGYKTMKSEIGYNDFVKELKVSDTGLMTYVYQGSSDEHTYQIPLAPEPDKALELNVAAKFTEVSKNTVIKITANASEGSKEGCRYRFSVTNNQTGKSANLTEYQTGNEFWWNSGSAGSKTITVEVQDSKGNYTKKSVDINVVDFTSSIKAQYTKVSNGVNNKITANAAGGIGTKTYRFRIKDEATGKVATLRDYQASSEFTWKTGSKGTKVIYVDVKDANESVATSAIRINVVPLTANISALTTLAVPESLDVLKASAAGGTGNYKYTFRIKNNDTGKTATLKDIYQVGNVYNWNAGPAGSKTLYVDVTDGTGAKATASVNVTVKKSDLAVKLTAASTTPKANAVNVLTATPSGGSGKYTYTFRIKNNVTGKTATLKEVDQVGNIYNWNAGPAGSKTLYVDVTDSTGKKVTASIDVTVK